MHTRQDTIDDLNDFIKKYSKEIKHFGMLEKPEESHIYLREHPHLVCDHLASYLVIWCVDLVVEEVSVTALFSFFFGGCCC